MQTQTSLILLSIFWILMSGCATGSVIQNEPTQSLNLIKYVVKQNMPRGVRATSPNGREFFSNYFGTVGFLEDATDKRDRAYAQVLILGDRRPYKTEVQVHLERKTERGYKHTAYDKHRARELAIKIRDELAKSREDRNIIDDFRAF